MPRGDHLHAALDRRQHPEPEQVDLQKAGVRAGVLVPHHHLPALHRGGHDGAAVDQRARRDDHPARVLAEMARQAVGLGGQLVQPAPAAFGLAALAQRHGDVLVDGLRRERLRGARDPLDLPRRQPQGLAQLADRAARPVGRKRRDERRPLRPEALVHPRDQHRADVAREVEVDVGQRRDALAEEAAEVKLVVDGVDVREAGEVADDRRDRGAAPPPRRQQAARHVVAADLPRHLPRELEHLVMQQEEPRQPEAADQRQLLVHPRGRSGPQAAAHRIARVEAPGAHRGELAVGLAVLGARVAVAEVGREVEDQRGGQALGLGHRLGVVLKARRHRRRRREHVGVVATPQRLGGVERRVLADRHEHVLQPRARRLVGVDVARRDAGHPEPSGQLGQRAIARPVVAMKRALQLDPKRVATEGGQQRAGVGSS